MYLTELEHEAFLRGRAAGLIPADVPLPTCDEEIDELILHVGFLFCRRIAYRNRQKKLRLMTLSAFTEEHLNDLVVRLPELRPEEVFAVTGLQREVYLNPLEGLYHYFSFGRKSSLRTTSPDGLRSILHRFHLLKSCADSRWNMFRSCGPDLPRPGRKRRWLK